MDDRKRAVKAAFRDLAEVANLVGETLDEQILAYADVVCGALVSGRKLLFCGNGGSAADAQHLATEYVVRMESDRAPMAAVALTTDTSLLTAASNDFGFDEVFARQVEALGNPGDVLILHSTSGESENLIRAAAVARRAGLRTVALTAKGGGRLREMVDVSIVVPTDRTSRAQEIHLAIGHEVCALAERHVSDNSLTRVVKAHQGSAAGEDPAVTPTSVTHEIKVTQTVIELLTTLRKAEKAQTLFYRALAAEAEASDDHEASERLNGLHADEQHHFSRITARLLEFGVDSEDLTKMSRPSPELENWEAEARKRETAEVASYEAALSSGDLDDETADILREILESEKHHAKELGGKWMPA